MQTRQLNSFQFEPLCPGTDKTHLHLINKLVENSQEVQKPSPTPQFQESGLILKSSFHNPAVDESEHQESCIFLKNEYMVLKSLNHPNIVRAFEFYENLQVVNDYKQCCMVLEQGWTDLQQFLFQKETKLSLIRNIFREIAQGLQYVHLQGFAHNDIKCGNILIFQNKENQKLEVKLADFEMSREKNFFTNAQQQKKFWSNRNMEYASPELTQQQRSRQNCQIVDEQRADVFAFGMILYKIIFGQIPFTRDQGGVTKNDSMYKFLAKKQYNRFWKNRLFIDRKIEQYQRKESDTNTELLKNLLQGLLAVDPKERLDMNQVVVHPWFTQ